MLEKELVEQIYKSCHVKPYPVHEIEIDNFTFNFSAEEPPNIQNDVFTINKRQASDHHVLLAISYALAQSAKLSVYEERVMELVDDTKHLPMALANTGKVKVSPKQVRGDSGMQETGVCRLCFVRLMSRCHPFSQVAQLIGKVFLQSSTLNLLSTVLDTPEYFWDVPDSLQVSWNRFLAPRAPLTALYPFRSRSTRGHASIWSCLHA